MDLLIFIGFLAITLIVGFSYGRQSKTIQDYALGGKNFSTLALTATIIATWFGGGTFYYQLPKLYSEGLFFFISSIGSPICLLIIGRLQAVRMSKFMHNVSTAEAMGDMYGKTIQVISSVSGAIVQVGYVAMQFRVISKVLALILGMQDERLTIAAAVIVILYSAWGGIRAVTFTDVVQFFTFGALIPVLALVIWGNLQDTHQITEVLTHNPKFQLREVVGWNTKFIGSVSLLLYFTTHGANPSMFQRLSMARNIEQARKAYTYSAFIALAIKLIITWMAILLLADNPNIEPDNLVNYLISKYTYTGFKGLLAAGIVALAMSTADSCMNSCAVLFANDFAKPLGFRKYSPLLTARFFSLVIGLLGLSLALYESDLLSLLLLTGSFYMPIVGVPLWLAIFGFRTSKRVVLTSMATGFTAVIVWRNFFLHTGIDSVMPATFVSLLTLLSAHYLLGEPGGWQKVSPDSPFGRRQAASREAWKNRKQTIRNFRLYPYLQQLLPPTEGMYSLLGFYAMFSIYIGLYTIERADIDAYDSIYTGIYQMLWLTTAFITYPVWPSSVKSKRFITFFWPLGIATTLLFTGMLLVILSHFHPMQMFVLLANFLLVALLLNWPAALVLTFSSIGLATLFFIQHTGEALHWEEIGSLQLRLLYGIFIFLGLLLAFFAYQEAFKRLGKKNKALQTREQDQQANLVQVSAEKQEALAAFQYTGAEQLLSITRELQTMHVAEEEKERMKALQTKLLPIAFHLQGIDTRAQDYLRLKKTELTLHSWCEQIKEKAAQKGVALNIHCRHDTKAREINGDAARLTSLLVNSMIALSTRAEGLEDKPAIFLRLEDTQLSYPLPDVKADYIKYVPAVRMALTVGDDLPAVKASYSPDLHGSSALNPAQELAHFVDSRIIKSHYGYAEITEDTFIYVVPVDVEDVRPGDMDKDYMEVGAKPIRADDHFKNDQGIDAQVQEATFLADVAARSDADLGMVKMALETIKWYHGPKKRNSGEPFYLHPLTVAHIVLDYNQDEETIIGALLHDTVEDTPMQLEHIEAMFGKEAAEVVDVVTHLQSIPGSIYKVKMSASENLQMLDRTDSTKGLYVKIADRMHNMRTIGGHSKVAKRKLIAQETVDFFIPLSEKLGLHKAAQEFEKMCLKVLAEKE